MTVEHETPGLSAEIVQLRRRVSELESSSAIIEADEIYTSSFTNAPVGIYIVQQGRFRYVNRRFQTSTGYTEEELADADSLSLVVPEDRKMVKEAAVAMLKRHRIRPYEFRVSNKSDETRWISGTISPIRFRGARAALGFYMDITARKRMDEVLATRTRELERSNADLEQFAYVASHDLQEPLRMISSYVQLLGRRYRDKLDADADEFIDFAVDGALRMQTLINDLLAYSRVSTEAKPFEPVDCDKVVDDVLANLEVAISDSAAEITRDPMPPVYADSTQLAQLFQNLIANALKFRGENPPKVHVGARSEGDEWQISIQDNGIGIDPRFSDRIFVIFQRLHGRANYPGNGIGLSICKKIVERHGGRIWVESQEGGGSTFCFTVPANGPPKGGRT